MFKKNYICKCNHFRRYYCGFKYLILVVFSGQGSPTPQATVQHQQGIGQGGPGMSVPPGMVPPGLVASPPGMMAQSQHPMSPNQPMSPTQQQAMADPNHMNLPSKCCFHS